MTATNAQVESQQPTTHDKVLFWGCFIALITTAFGFIARMFLITEWGTQFGLDEAEAGRLAGIGVWPFAVSIILFSLFIDKIGYKVAMIFAFLGHLTWGIMGVSAYFVAEGGNTEAGYQLLYWGSLVMALANGTVEAFINPVVATMFSKQKTKWLNILHAGWPGGLVLAGVITIYMADVEWWIKIGILIVPTIIYFVMLVPLKFPVHERVASGVSYREMLSEFGILGALVASFLITLQLIDFFTGIDGLTQYVVTDPGTVAAFTKNQVLSLEAYKAAIGTYTTPTLDIIPQLLPWVKMAFICLGVAMVAAFGLYTRSLGRPLMFFLVLIMMPLATTEIGTDGWITGIMEGVFRMTPEQVAAAGGIENVLVINGAPFIMHPGWVLVYTSLIMMVLRFCAGPIVHRISPLGLLVVSAVLAIAGLLCLSMAAGMMIFAAATLYAFGKTFFWPTTLGVVAEQTPKGGALTLNAIAGIGMLAVGTLGFPFIGALQAGKQIAAVTSSEVAEQVPGLVVEGELTTIDDKRIYEIIPYGAIDEAEMTNEIAPVPDAKDVTAKISSLREHSKQKALADMAWFPGIMLVAYICLIIYFKSQGGYQAKVLTGHAAEDEKFTGGVPGPADQ